MAALVDGGFVVTWTSTSQDGSYAGIYARRFAVDGTAVGREVLINATTAGSKFVGSTHGSEQVATLANGRVVQVWGSDVDYQVYARLINIPGAETTPPAAPTIAGFSPDTGALGDRLTSDNTPILSGTAEADSYVRIYDGATLVGWTLAANGVEWMTTLLPLGDGPHSLTATATDFAANESEASVPLAVTIDTVAPAAGVLSFTGLTDTGSSASDGITQDNSFGLNLAGNGAGTVAYQRSSNGGSTWSATGTSQASLADGSYQFRAVVTDAPANSAATAVIQVTVDRSAPAAPGIAGFADDTAPTGDGVTTDNTLILSGAAEAGTLVQLSDGLTLVGSAVATGGNWSIAPAALATGPHSFTAKATDVAGNPSGASSPILVTVVLGTVATPTFSKAAGTYSTPQTVAISCATAGATIHYTTDGRTPTESDPVIPSGGTVLVDRTLTLKAKAWKPAWIPSTVRSAVYTMKVATPTFSPDGAGTDTPQSVRISCATPGVAIHYTTNGLTPTESDPVIASGSSLLVDHSLTRKAKAWRSGWTASGIKSATYTISEGGQGGGEGENDG